MVYQQPTRKLDLQLVIISAIINSMCTSVGKVAGKSDNNSCVSEFATGLCIRLWIRPRKLIEQFLLCELLLECSNF